MRKLIILGTAASLLALAACNREAESAAPVDEATAAADTAADAAATGAGSGSGSGSTSAGAAGSSGTASPYSTNDPMPPATDGPGPVTDATRAGAKEKAESTNLHPKTN